MSVFKVGSNKSSQNNFPSVRPTLDLDFANSKTLDPRITFTRASGGSYVGADGLIKLAGVNEPRFDHDPVTGESLGFLVEEARTNLITYSQDVDNVAWTKNGVTVAVNSTTAPDGTLTADSLIENYGAQSTVIISQSGGNIFASVFAKEIPGSAKRYLYIGIDAETVGSNRWAYAIVDVASGSFVLNSNFIQHTVSNVSVTSFPNGWKRISGYFSSPLDAKRFVIGLSNTTLPGNSNSSIPYTGDGTSGIYVWGAQIEASASFPTSYIPTEGSTRTRAADDAQITGKNFSSWYNQSEGTIFSQFYLDSNRTNTRWVASVGAISTSGSGNTGFIIGRVAPDYLYAECRVNTTPQYSATASFPSSRIAKISYGLKNADQRVAFNGTLASESTGSFAPLSQNRMDIGSLLGIEYLCGTISRLTYYPKRLTDAQLQVLTR